MVIVLHLSVRDSFPLYNKIKLSVCLSVRVNEFLRGVFYSGSNENIDNCLDGNCFEILYTSFAIRLVT